MRNCVVNLQFLVTLCVELILFTTKLVCFYSQQQNYDATFFLRKIFSHLNRYIFFFDKVSICLLVPFGEWNDTKLNLFVFQWICYANLDQLFFRFLMGNNNIWFALNVDIVNQLRCRFADDFIDLISLWKWIYFRILWSHRRKKFFLSWISIIFVVVCDVFRFLLLLFLVFFSYFYSWSRNSSVVSVACSLCWLLLIILN